MTIDRRAFHKQIGSWATVAAAGSWFSQCQPAAATEEFPPGRYVDVHTHLGQTWNQNQPLTAEELLRWMDANDIAQAVVLPLINPEASSYPLTTDFVPLVAIDWVDEPVHAAGHAALLTANRKELSLVDCVSFELMRRRDVSTALALDADFGDQGFSVVP